MQCRKCSKESFLIRGQCADCAPDLHDHHAKAMAAVEYLDIRCKKETGKGSLDDWYGYEKWIEDNIDDPEIRVNVKLLQPLG